MDVQIKLPPAAAAHSTAVEQQLQQVNEAEAPQMDAADTDVDKKAVQRLVSKLRKTLERPEQADLELDPDGFLRLSALGGKFRREKMAPIVGLSTDVPISEITTKFKKVVNKGNPGVFEWQLAEDKTDMSVRLKGHAGAARAAARAEVELEPRFMFPSGSPHSLRGLREKGDARVGEILESEGLRPGIKLLFVEPGGIAEYRGVPNEPIIEMLHALHASDSWQLAVLTWAGTDSIGPRLGTMQQRAAFLTGRFGVYGVPAFSASGSRAGLVAFCQLAAEVLGTTAVLLTRGKDSLEASFSSRFLKPLIEHSGGALGDPAPTHPLVTVWSYASQSTRSTSSTGSSSRRPTTDESGGDSPEAAAQFAVTIWSGVASAVSSSDSKLLRAQSAVMVDSADIAKGLTASAECDVPLVSVDVVASGGARMPLPSNPSVFSSLFSPEAAAAASVATAAAGRHRLPPAGLLVVAALLEDDTNVVEWVGDNGDVLAELTASTVEQARTLGLIGHAFDQGWVPADRTILSTIKALHDADVIEDDGFRRWEQQGPSSKSVKQAEPFLRWLEEADEDEGDDDGN